MTLRPDWAPRDCFVCGKRVTIAKGGVFSAVVSEGEVVSGLARHADCRINASVQGDSVVRSVDRDAEAS